MFESGIMGGGGAADVSVGCCRRSGYSLLARHPAGGDPSLRRSSYARIDSGRDRVGDWPRAEE